MQISIKSFVVIERWSKILSIGFFWMVNIINFILLINRGLTGVQFILGLVLSFIPYIVYLKFVRGTLERSVLR